jgi:hypothetical protein
VSPSGPSDSVTDQATLIANGLSQITSGWTPAAGVSSETLAAARAALAASLVAGKTVVELHATQTPINTGPPSNPKLSAQILEIASQAVTANPATTIAVVRSAYAATRGNPSGAPVWARSAKKLQTLGPFLDPAGTPHYVDLILFTVSTQFAFGNAATPFSVFPIVHFLLPPGSVSQFNLGSGSVWFPAEWLASALPAGSFTGFSISGGTLISSQPMNNQDGVYVIPNGATLTVNMTLVPSAPVTSSGNPGADAAAAVFTPPAEVEMIFEPSSAKFQSISNANAKAYGSSVSLQWNEATPVALEVVPEIAIPCTPSPAGFSFQTALSEIFTPSGSAAVTNAAWGLPLVATSISSLPENAGPGAAVLALSAGASLQTALQPVMAETEWLLEIATGGLFAFVNSTGGGRERNDLPALAAESSIETERDTGFRH